VQKDKEDWFLGLLFGIWGRGIESIGFKGVVRQLKKPTPNKITENNVSNFRNFCHLCDV
jgi:hypothetical protein